MSIGYSSPGVGVYICKGCANQFGNVLEVQSHPCEYYQQKELIEKLYRKLNELESFAREANSALKVISTWATFRNGEALVPEHVENLCKKVLTKSAEVLGEK